MLLPLGTACHCWFRIPYLAYNWLGCQLDINLADL
ncbi:hypothetical protein BVRB_5g099810 [Beta vulgaris subsp. vulgaris]|nr:hypothetical protein BVRB_5g099810 [Beta vulgaris subsp. vulgaris]